MKRSFSPVLSLFILLPVLSLTGLGCINVKTQSTDNGGIYVTSDAGAKWTAKDILPLAAGLSSISTSDILNMTFDPNDADTLYLGTVANGLLVSYDNAETWQRVKEPEMRGGQINAVAVDPSNKCVVYVAKGSNIMKTEDCLRTFDTQAFVETNNKTVNVVRVDWYNPKTVWAGTVQGDILKSVDAGKTWSTVERASDQIIDVLVSNADSRIVVVITSKKGMWRTTDGGTTWTQMDDAFSAYRSGLGKEFSLTQTKDGHALFLTCEYGIFRSTDNGASWTDLTLLTKPNSARIYSFTVQLDNANILYYGTDSTLYSSTDGGANWATRQLPSIRAASAMQVDPNDSKSLYVGYMTIKK